MTKKRDWHKINRRPPEEFPRNFLPEKMDLASWGSYAAAAGELLSRKISSAKGLKKWLDEYCEFINVIWEEEARIYIDMTCDTTNASFSERYLNFAKNVKPELERFENEARIKIRNSRFAVNLSRRKFGRWLASLKGRSELYSEKNIPLYMQLKKTINAYQKVRAAMTVSWKGKTKTVLQMNTVLHESNREIRESAWRKTWERFAQDRKRLDTIFDAMFSLRCETAENLGLRDFREYAFKKFDRTDYSVEDCMTFHQTVEQVVVPYYREILAWKREQLGVKVLRPWDMACDNRGRKQKKTFKKISDLTKNVKSIFKEMDTELYDQFLTMENRQLLDLENRVGKRPGGYQIILDEIRLPFIFMNAVGSVQDIFTLLHECGHAFHLFQCRNQALYYNREAPMEFCEVASMSMERMGMQYLDSFLPPEQKAREIVRHNEEVFRTLIWVCIIDSFQHWLYTHPEHTKRERNKKWIDIMERYQTGLDWSGLYNYRKTAWHRQLHVFQYPFYYIEYGIAQLGALQMEQKFKRDPDRTLTTYKKALSYGGTLGLCDLFKKAGLTLDFSPSSVKPLMKSVFNEWQQYRDY